MKLIKITDGHYVVVDEYEIKIGEWCFDTETGKFYQSKGNVPSNKWVLKITHSTQPLEDRDNSVISIKPVKSAKTFYVIKPLSLQEVKELIGEVDVEKFISKKAGKYVLNMFGNNDWNAKLSYIAGYNQALEDNKKKKYTEEQLIWAIQEAYGHGQDDEFDGVNKIEESIKAITKHLQPKTEWDVEIEMEDSFTENNEVYVDENNIKGNYYTHSKKPKLDSNGCVILKLKLK